MGARPQTRVLHFSLHLQQAALLLHRPGCHALRRSGWRSSTGVASPPSPSPTPRWKRVGARLLLCSVRAWKHFAQGLYVPP